MDGIDVVGAGGIGCAVGYALVVAGHSVRFVESNTQKVEAGRKRGVQIAGRPALPASFVHFADWQPSPERLVWLCTKCYDNEPVLARLPAPARIVPVQNGFDTALIQRQPAAEGIASFVAQCEPDRPCTRITRPGELHLGPGLPPELLSGLRAAKLFGVRSVPAILPYKNAKLMYNAAISPLAAAAGLDNGALLSHAPARRLFFALLQENYRILAEAGCPLARIGPFAPRTVARILRRPWLARAMARFFEPSLRGTYCSMAGEIQRGRTELDNYTGHLLRIAARAAPFNAAVYDVVSAMTRDRAAPTLSRLQQIEERVVLRPARAELEPTRIRR